MTHVTSFRSALLVLLTMLALTACGSPTITALDEATVRTTLDAIAQAARQEDADAILTHLAQDVQIEVVLPQGGQRIQFNHEQYGDYLRDAFAAADPYTLTEHTIVEIVIAADGQSATATERLIEEVTLGSGQTHRSATTQTSTLILLDGRPQVITIQATARSIR